MQGATGTHDKTTSASGIAEMAVSALMLLIAGAFLLMNAVCLSKETEVTEGHKHRSRALMVDIIGLAVICLCTLAAVILFAVGVFAATAFTIVALSLALAAFAVLVLAKTTSQGSLVEKSEPNGNEGTMISDQTSSVIGAPIAPVVVSTEAADETAGVSTADES